MRPLRITARNVVCYRDLDLDVSDVRNAVIVGANGAGKSLLVDLVRIALYDEGRLGARALAKMIGPWGDSLYLRVEFEHRGGLHRVTRTRRATAKTSSRTDVLETFDGTTWAPVDLTVDALLGVPAAAMGATAFLRHRGADGLGDFGPARPEERKAILRQLRRTDRYADYEAASRRAASAADVAVRVADERIAAIHASHSAAVVVMAGAPSHEAAVTSLQAQIDAAELALASARAASSARTEALATLQRARAGLEAATGDAAAYRNTRAVVEARVQAAKSTMAGEAAARAAAERRAQLADEWHAQMEARAVATARVAAASREIDRAQVALVDVQRRNDAARVRVALTERLERLSEETARLRTIADAWQRVCSAREAVRVADAAVEAHRRREALEAERAIAAADVRLLEGIAEPVREAIQARSQIDADTATAERLGTVPCHGADAFAACRFLADAVAARGRVSPATAALEAAVAGIMATTDRAEVVQALSSGDWRPLSVALQGARARLHEIQASLAALGAAAPADPGAHDRLAEALAGLSCGEPEAAGAAAAHAAAERTRWLVSGELQAVKDSGEIVDDAPLLAAVEAAKSSYRAEVDAESAILARVGEIEREGATLKAAADKMAEIRMAALVIDESGRTLAGLGDGSRFDVRVNEAKAEVARAESAVAGMSASQVDDAVARVSALRQSLATAQHGLALSMAAATTAEGLGRELEALATSRATSARSRATAMVLGRFYSEAPDLVLENDRTAIQEAANDWLRATSALQLDLVMQRPQKRDASKVHETLDVDVVKPSGRAVRETCSAGELFRVDIGLALAIGQTLGTGRSWITIDEGFGSLKGDVIVSVTRTLHAMLCDLDGLWVVEHHPLVIDVFPTRITVTPGPDGSTVRID